MSWYAQTEEAQKHIEEFKGCEKCIWIEESSWAMVQTQEYIEAKKNQPKPAKPKPELKWNYKLGRYM